MNRRQRRRNQRIAVERALISIMGGDNTLASGGVLKHVSSAGANQKNQINVKEDAGGQKVPDKRIGGHPTGARNFG